MNEQTFKRLMGFIKSIAIENQDYATGYQRGLRRHYHGENFGTDAEHQKYMGLDGHREDIGRGYRDGFNGLEPDPSNTNNPRKAGRKKLGRIDTTLPLDPPVKSALQAWAKSNRMTMTAAINLILREKLDLPAANAASKEK